MLAHWKLDERSVGYAQLEDIADIACRGPVTPDHTLQTKRIPAIFDRDCVEGVEQFQDDYLRYFERHDDGSLALYAHLRTGSVTARPIGARIAAGEYLGVIGSSGNSTGPHLHFEVGFTIS